MLGVHLIVPGLHQTLVLARIELLTYFHCADVRRAQHCAGLTPQVLARLKLLTK